MKRLFADHLISAGLLDPRRLDHIKRPRRHHTVCRRARAARVCAFVDRRPQAYEGSWRKHIFHSGAEGVGIRSPSGRSVDPSQGSWCECKLHSKDEGARLQRFVAGRIYSDARSREPRLGHEKIGAGAAGRSRRARLMVGLVSASASCSCPYPFLVCVICVICGYLVDSSRVPV